MAGAVQGSRSHTALITAHSASVSSTFFFDIAEPVCSTTVEDVNRNIYKCKESPAREALRERPSPFDESRLDVNREMA